MRFWPTSAPAPATPPPPAIPRDLALQIEEGYLVALSALRLSVKNGIILRILRDGAAWNEEAAADLARQVIANLARELSDTAVLMSEDRAEATPTERESLAARSRRDLARVQRRRDEADRLDARSRVLRGVVAKLRAASTDAEFVRQLAVRARDDTLAEVVQARLIPRAQPQLLSDDEQRAAIDGVKADLQVLIDSRAGY